MHFRALLTLPVLTLASIAPSSRAATPAWPELNVAPLQVEARRLPDVPPREDEARLLRRLAEEATTRAERSAARQGLAGTLHASVGEGSSRVPILRGRVRLPLSVPARQQGAGAQFCPSPFAEVELTLEGTDHALLAHSTATIRCEEVHWLAAGRQRLARPLDDVLVDFVRKGVDRAVKQLAAEVRGRGDGHNSTADRPRTR